VQLLRGVGPAGVGVARDLPFLPGFVERGIQRFAQGFELRLPLLPDDVDLGVVGDRLERDVRHALIDEAVAEVALHRLRARRAAGDFGFLELAFAGIGEQVERIAGAHDAGAGQRECNARGVDRDPAAAPLLGDGGGGAGTAGRVEYEVAGVGGHEEAAL
jgi:hypothetical protein